MEKRIWLNRQLLILNFPIPLLKNIEEKVKLFIIFKKLVLIELSKLKERVSSLLE